MRSSYLMGLIHQLVIFAKIRFPDLVVFDPSFIAMFGISVAIAVTVLLVR